jgi:excisionase family DNA binding protein
MSTAEFLNVRQVAREMGVHENTIRNWEERGLLNAIRLPGSGFRRFPRDEVERMRREMLEQYAPATEMPEQARTGVKGRVVNGDLL